VPPPLISGVKVIGGCVSLRSHEPITDCEMLGTSNKPIVSMRKLLRGVLTVGVVLSSGGARHPGPVAFAAQPGTGAAAGAIATPPTISQQPLIRTIYNWGDDVAVITDKWMPSKARAIYSLATVDARSSQIIPFRAINCDSYDDIAYSSQFGKIVVCGRGDAAQLYQLTERGWTKFSEPIQGKEFRCTIEGDRIAAISDTALYLFSSSTKPSLRISIAIPDFTVANARALLTEQSVLIAYDHGEFGGALYHVDLSQSTTPTKLLDDNVKYLARSPSGAIWAAAGLGHLGYEHGALYRVQGPNAETVASVSGDIMTGESKIREKSGVQFPGLTSVSGLAFGDTDRAIVVFPELGVFELDDNGFSARYRGSLTFTYDDSLRGLRFIAQSGPVGVVTTTSGDLYVASRSLGVFWIRGNGQAASIKQVTFARASSAQQKIAR